MTDGFRRKKRREDAEREREEVARDPGSAFEYGCQMNMSWDLNQPVVERTSIG